MNLLEVKNIKKYFPKRQGFGRRSKDFVKAVDGISFSLGASQTLGVVGESGCGKTTLGKMALGLLSPTAGSVLFEGKDVFKAKSRELRDLRRDFQIIFQDPFNSLNPRMKIKDIVAEPLLVHRLVSSRRELLERVKDRLESVGLGAVECMNRYPHELSGGERQRVGIARALATSPKLVICDEPTSNLDLSIQAQVLNLLLVLQEEYDLSYLFISHDLRVIEHMSDYVMVMYMGKVMEYAPRIELYSNIQHPYTKRLFAAAYGEEASSKPAGEAKEAISLPSGCYFCERCPHAFSRCEKEDPQLRQVSSGHFVACHLAF